ncbi:MAG: hypothetical protein D6768_16520 [Chloroflexi bacterium]|nr:MAG: hypothetical protein D6768_16520 [Chloroflexota bacterium]
MKKGIAIILASLLTVAVIAAGLAIWLPTQATAREASQMEYKIKAGNATLNRKVMGEVATEVNGVPASPVHSFVWDGDGVTPIKAKVEIKINPVTNSGEITAEWKDENGEWTFKQTAFSPPPHSTGLRVGPSASSTELVMDDPVTTNVYLHGNTTAGGPVLPTDFNLLATWGPAEVTLNGQPFNNPFDGPAPLWVAHTMTTVGVRNSADGTVRTTNGDIFNPMAAANGAVDNDDLEFHLVFHDAPGPAVAGNFPPPLSFFYHLTFEDVKIDIKHAE